MPRRADLSGPAAVVDLPLGALAGQGEGKLRPLGPGAVRVWSREDLGEGSSRTCLLRLLELRRLEAAATLLAFALPEREVVWWGCMCVGSNLAAVPDAERHAVAAAERWVRVPGPDTRAATLAAGKKAPPRSAAAAIAFAAFQARPHQAFSSQSGRWVRQALRRILETVNSAEGDAMLLRFIGSACDIATGGAGRLAPGDDGVFP